jgi:hypothetical protein
MNAAVLPIIPVLLLATFTIDVGLINQTALTFIEFLVGGSGDHDPATGTDTYTNPDIDGATYQVSQRGVGPRSFDAHEIQTVAGGGFKLLNGEKFNSGDRWFIIVAQTSTTHVPVISKALFVDIIEINANVTIGTTHFNKMLEANASALVITATFPSLGTIPEDTMFGFNTHAGSQRYFAIQLASGETMRFQRGLKNITWLGQAETLIIIKKGSLLKVLDYGGDYPRVGEKVKSDLQPLNGLPETGGWYNIADVPRFFYEFVNKIPLGQLSAIVSGNVSERTKFAIDSIGGRFWMPDTGGYFERNVDPDGNVDLERVSGSRYTGSIQNDSVGQFTIHGMSAAVAGGNGGTPNMDVLDTNIADPFNGGPKDFTVFTGTDTKPKNVDVNTWRII